MSLPPPEPRLRASVVVPAKDEEALIERCLASLAGQSGVESEEYEVLLVLDRCTDATADRALEAAVDYSGLRLHLLEGPGLGAGHARRVGMEAACERLFSLDRPDALIASTDADTVVARDWLYRQLAAVSDGARAVGGRIELLDEEGAPEEVRSSRERRGEARHRELLKRQGAHSRTEHWQFSGASMSLTAEAYREVGGLEPRDALEDEHLENALERCSIPIQRPLDVRVSTSPRLIGRASRGLAKDLSLDSWLRNNTYRKPHSAPYSIACYPVSVISPATSSVEAATPDAAGLEVIRVSLHEADPPLATEFGPAIGRGDALWRGLSEAGGEIVVLLPDLSAESVAAIPALVGPLLQREDLRLVKGYPEDAEVSEVSRLVGRPMINLHHPDLAGLVDPLSPFVAARRGLLESLSFPVGAGVDASLPLDTAGSCGACAVAQAALPARLSPIAASAEDSYEIMSAFLSRSGEAGSPPPPAPLNVPDPVRGGFDSRRANVGERPPLTSISRPSTTGENRGNPGVDKELRSREVSGAPTSFANIRLR